jgi:hypothetical protein
MARGEITVTTSTQRGIALIGSSYSTGGLMFQNNGRSLLIITNAASSEQKRLVMEPSELVDSGLLEVADLWSVLAVCCSSGAWRQAFGPFRPSVYNQQSGTDVGKAYLSLTSTASSESPYTYLTAVQSSAITFEVVTTP